MDSYISYLIDNFAEVKDNGVKIDCKNEIVAKRVSEFLDIKRDNKVVNGEFYKIFNKVQPIEKYKEYYWKRYFQETKLIEPIPEKDDYYLAALFDYHGCFKYTVKSDKCYPIVEFRNKEILNDVSILVRKKYKNNLALQGKELLSVLDRLEDKLIIQKDKAKLFVNCLFEPENSYHLKMLEEYTKSEGKVEK